MNVKPILLKTIIILLLFGSGYTTTAQNLNGSFIQTLFDDDISLAGYHICLPFDYKGEKYFLITPNAGLKSYYEEMNINVERYEKNITAKLLNGDTIAINDNYFEQFKFNILSEDKFEKLINGLSVNDLLEKHFKKSLVSKDLPYASEYRLSVIYLFFKNQILTVEDSETGAVRINLKHKINSDR